MLVLDAVSKVHPNGFKAVDQVSLEVATGELVCLIGPSGCGKTTTLEMINRLVEPTGGKILLNGQDTVRMAPELLRRDIGYVIQQTGLFPHMTIEQNIGVVMQLKGWKKERQAERVTELLELVGLDPALYRRRYPKELSGGQQQRIGVLRALAAEPELILMDEPFGALDPITRDQLQEELKKLQQRLHKTIVFVTHDMGEAVKLADRVVFMRSGKIVQAAAPAEMLRNPKDEFVRDFVGRHTHGGSAGGAMTALPALLPAELTVTAAIAELRAASHHTGAVVSLNGGFKGLTNLDQLEEELAKGSTATLCDLVTGVVPVVQSAQSMDEVTRLMEGSGQPYLPVVDGEGRLVGLMTRTAVNSANAVNAVQQGA